MYKQQEYLVNTIVDHKDNRLILCKFLQLIFCILYYPIPSLQIKTGEN